MFDIKEYIKGDVKFSYYKDNNLWYITSNDFVFPVPVQDIGTGTFKNTDKAMLFMRYIRKHLEIIQNEKLSRKY